MIRTIDKDVTTLTSPFVLLHVANDKRVMGAGVAKAISTKWPRVREDYITTDADLMKLGNIVITPVEEGESFVVSMIAQEGFGSEGRCYLNYQALARCLNKVSAFVSSIKEEGKDKLLIFVPHGMGAGLAGGDWGTVYGLLQSELDTLDVTCCKHG